MSWKLICDQGRQIWKFDDQEEKKSSAEKIFSRNENRNCSDEIFRENALKTNFRPLNLSLNEYQSLGIGIFDDQLSRSAVEQTLKGLNYYLSLQSEDGHWPGDYGGPMFLLAGAVITSYVTRFQFQAEQINEMIKYLFNHQLIDGGWTTHLESDQSTMFATVLNFISLRILGISSNDQRMKKALKFIVDQGGAMFAPSWAKFWLCILNVMPWNGINSLLPEFWLLPSSFPIHPSNYWCHSRMVYLPMSYIYAQKWCAQEDSFIRQLRSELYSNQYETIDFTQHRNSISSLDLNSPPSRCLKLIYSIFNFYELFYNENLREKASKYLLELIEGEDEQTNSINIGPVNKFLNMISIYFSKGRESEEFAKHLNRLDDYLWLSEDGMKLQGYNGSQLWDTVFSIQAILETKFDHLFPRTLSLAYHYLESNQILENIENSSKYFRDPSKGGWPFSTRDHGWPITDCTAEAIKSTLLLNEKDFPRRKQIDNERIENAIDFLLFTQNKDGGWASYEKQRGSPFLEWFNPSEIFRNIMIDYSYVECTSASLQALIHFQSKSIYKFEQIRQSIEKGKNYLLKEQREDGSWIGSWAVCFTYGTWFALEALIQLGFSIHSKPIEKAKEFLLSKQNQDGGWGESFHSSLTKSYIQHEQSQIVNTSWALLSLLLIESNSKSINKGIEFILKNQLSNGDWIQQSISGIFNGTCTINYSNYRNIFPLWALGRFLQSKRKEKKRNLSLDYH